MKVEDVPAGKWSCPFCPNVYEKFRSMKIASNNKKLLEIFGEVPSASPLVNDQTRADPTEEPIVKPSKEPTTVPTEEPIVEPSKEPTTVPEVNSADDDDQEVISAKNAAQELICAAYFNFANILAESSILFQPSPPSKTDLQRLRYPAELEEIPNYQKELQGVPPFTSNIRFPMGNKGSTTFSPPHRRLSRSSRAFNMTADLLRRVHQGVGIVLEGTSFNHPEFSAKQNYVAGYSILLSALMALNLQFPRRIKMILIKGEVLPETSKRPNRADFHEFIVVGGIEDVSIIRLLFEKMIIDHGGMSAVLHQNDQTRVSEKSGINAPQGWFTWIRYMLKAETYHKGHIDRDRTRTIMSAAGVEPIGERDDLLLMYLFQARFLSM
jgi:hypothetical protein